jgi:hypothetical protein
MKRNRLIGIFLLCVILSSGCGILNPEKLVTSEEHGYDINPNTLLDDLSRGEPDAFSEFYPALVFRTETDIEVPWKETDYLEIAGAVHRLENNGNILEWGIYQITYIGNCQQIAEGPFFRYGRLEFHKLTKASNPRTRFTTEFSIIPDESQVYTRVKEYYPNWNAAPLPTLSSYPITAEKALEITEASDGQRIRELVQNNCTVSLLFFPGGPGFTGWQISYNQPDVKKTDYVEFRIDPVSGEIVKKEVLEGLLP